ncbi:MAG TPA: bL28 family ribosomal protein [Candidatus Magasanikbacteria bacterium]|nr:bL28 family ribosomal protein [Candidatus Magasanikbacteria bacterium]
MRKCELCKKGSVSAANRSHSKVKTLRKQHANLQKFMGLMLCSSCRRTIQKRVTQAATPKKAVKVAEAK